MAAAAAARPVRRCRWGQSRHRRPQPARPPGLLELAMMDERRSNVRRLVLAAVIAAFGIASLGLWGVPVVANPLEPKGLEVTADFPQTIGLYRGSRVMVQGVGAGSVKSVKSVTDRVRVTRSVHGGSLDPNVVATVRLRSLI